VIPKPTVKVWMEEVILCFLMPEVWAFFYLKVLKLNKKEGYEWKFI